MRLSGALNNRAPGPSTWQEDILLLNHSREIKKAGSFALPAHAISTKSKHLLVIYSIPTRGFTAAVSVFRGTPPPKPLDCKIWLNISGAHFCTRWAHPTCGEPRLSRACLSFVSIDIIKTSPSFRSQIVHLSFLRFAFGYSGKTKNPAYIAVSRVWKNSIFLLLPAYLRFIQIRFWGLPFIRCG